MKFIKPTLGQIYKILHVFHETFYVVLHKCKNYKNITAKNITSTLIRTSTVYDDDLMEFKEAYDFYLETNSTVYEVL